MGFVAVRSEDRGVDGSSQTGARILIRMHANGTIVPRDMARWNFDASPGAVETQAQRFARAANGRVLSGIVPCKRKKPKVANAAS